MPGKGGACARTNATKRPARRHPVAPVTSLPQLEKGGDALATLRRRCEAELTEASKEVEEPTMELIYRITARGCPICVVGADVQRGRVA